MPDSIAFISDIHGNLPALSAVLADIAEQGVTQIICLGDVVGYGGQPGECVDVLRERGIVTVKGNHDSMVADGIPAGDDVGITMAMMWDWTEQALTTDQRQWLRELPMTLEHPDFQAVHATLKNPAGWGYVLTASHASAHFMHQQRPLCFIGHSHWPAFWVAGETDERSITSLESIDMALKQLVNVGSVGQPRDGDENACYLIYRPEQKDVWWRRVPYDIAAAQRAIEEAGLPIKFADRLRFGK
ncbi:metallophosphoesterase family protein [Brevifollis gellanilyticus]|uniref:Metallophosphoesterase n=1 Tax=Brevifollis gellanilyticus TaxID=748831 RepID=A0A512MD49_9BACT|nr:metallophosphoesterase family protein [Brevifollis gellanilyticus]GEP44632.1 metallophosphoesterase [Brevifollis gellanilyticus]